MYGGQSNKGFLVDHHLLLSKRRNDTALYWDIVENVCSSKLVIVLAVAEFGLKTVRLVAAFSFRFCIVVEFRIVET